MSKQAAKLAAIHAPKLYRDYSATASRPNAVREIIIGLTLGLAAGFYWKTYHWNEKKKINKYYRDLAEIYEKEDAEV